AESKFLCQTSDRTLAEIVHDSSERGSSTDEEAGGVPKVLPGEAKFCRIQWANVPLDLRNLVGQEPLDVLDLVHVVDRATPWLLVADRRDGASSAFRRTLDGSGSRLHRTMRTTAATSAMHANTNPMTS